MIKKFKISLVYTNFFQFDSDGSNSANLITLKSIPWTNHFWEKSRKFLAQGNKRDLDGGQTQACLTGNSQITSQAHWAGQPSLRKLEMSAQVTDVTR